LATLSSSRQQMMTSELRRELPMARRSKMSTSQLLVLFASIHPEAYDAIHPQGPLTHAAHGASVSLNPQPIPPGVAFQVAAAQMAHGLAGMGLKANVRGESTDFVREFIDDWCGTPWPHKWPWPPPGPLEPDPSPWAEVMLARLIGAIIFASIGSRLPEGQLGATFSEGAERLAQAAIPAG
jgi:hypothetical protein